MDLDTELPPWWCCSSVIPMPYSLTCRPIEKSLCFSTRQNPFRRGRINTSSSHVEQHNKATTNCAHFMCGKVLSPPIKESCRSSRLVSPPLRCDDYDDMHRKGKCIIRLGNGLIRLINHHSCSYRSGLDGRAFDSILFPMNNPQFLKLNYVNWGRIYSHQHQRQRWFLLLLSPIRPAIHPSIQRVSKQAIGNNQRCTINYKQRQDCNRNCFTSYIFMSYSTTNKWFLVGGSVGTDSKEYYPKVVKKKPATPHLTDRLSAMNRWVSDRCPFKEEEASIVSIY